MWRERLIRFLLVGVAALIILGGIRYLVGGREEPVSAPEIPINEERIEPLKEEILGVVGRVLPGGKREESDLKPVQNVQEQTQNLIESIKSLPEDQIEVIKKQIYKEFCEELIGE